MRRKLMNVITGFLMLWTAATGVLAANRPKGTSFTNATEGYYTFYPQSGTGYGYVHVAIYTDVDGVMRAELWVLVEDPISSRFLSASGYVPTSTFEITSKGLRMNIADLHELPELFVYEEGFPAQIPLNCTMEKTSAWEENSIGTYVERAPQPDGTSTVSKTMSKYTRSSIYVEGNLADYSFTSLSSGYAALYVGNYKSHFVP